MKQVTRICDRCNQPIICGNDMVLDQLAADYPGKDICLDCDIQIQAAMKTAKESELRGRSPADVLNEWLKIYD